MGGWVEEETDLEEGMRQGRPDLLQTLPRVFVKKTVAHIVRGPTPAFEREGSGKNLRSDGEKGMRGRKGREGPIGGWVVHLSTYLIRDFRSFHQIDSAHAGGKERLVGVAPVCTCGGGGICE